MLKTPADSFGSTFLASEQDLASEVTKKLLSNGSIVINFYIASLLLQGSGPITLYHLLGIALLLITTIASISFATTFRNNSYYLINQCAILMLPIFMEAYISKSWISYGLVIAIFVLFSAIYENTIIFIFCLVTATTIQYWVASKNFTGVIDNQDLLLLDSYFSTTWVLIAGIGVRVARFFYLDYCKQIDDQLYSLQDQMQESELRQSSLNLKDHINLAIHGTLLNTLISYNQFPSKVNKQKELAKDIEKDLKKIETLGNFENLTDFQNLIKQLLLEQGHLVEFTSIQLSSDLKDVIDPLFEIVREIGLNTKKHTQSRSFKIVIINQLNQTVVEIMEIFPETLDLQTVEKKLIGANRSVSLFRIVNSSRFNLRISATESSDALIYSLVIPKKLQPDEVISKINYLRKRSVTRNIELLSGISIFYSFLALVGFISLKVPIYVEGAVFLPNFLIAYQIWKNKKSFVIPVISQFVLLTIIPYILILDTSCQNLLYTPWLFNAIFGALLYSISVASNPFLKWGPGVLFITQNLATKLFFPQECNTLLDGSTPGFVFLLIFGYLMAKLRERNTIVDNNLDISIQESLLLNSELSDYVSLKRAQLLDDIKNLVDFLKINELTEEDLSKTIKVYLHQIRAFLVCSQHFKSIFIRELYEDVRLMFKQMKTVKVSILTNGSLLHDLQSQETILNSIRSFFSYDCEILIYDKNTLNLDLYINGSLMFSHELTK